MLAAGASRGGSVSHGRVGAIGYGSARSPNLDRLERMGCCDSAAGRYAAGDEGAGQLVSTMIRSQSARERERDALHLPYCRRHGA